MIDGNTDVLKMDVLYDYNITITDIPHTTLLSI